MAAILLRKQEERERAKFEMERIDRERDREHEFEEKRRKGGKKKGKKDIENSPFAQSGYSQGRGGYPTWDGSQKNHFHHVRKMTQVISLLQRIEDTNMKHQDSKQIKVFYKLILLMKLVTSLGRKNFRKRIFNRESSFHSL